MAAEDAETFAVLAFVERDADRAYALLNPQIEEEMTADEFAVLLAQMHPAGRPESVRATEYQPLPGYRGMNIFLEGDAGLTTFYYRLLMEGTAASGYRVTGLWRGAGPYPNPEDRRLIH